MKKILVVDDEENIQLLYKEELTEDGFNVEVASSADEAMRKIKEFSPDVITLDIKMPQVDGIEFLRALRETYKDIPVIINSAYSIFKQDFQVWASDAYIVKSSNTDELKAAIKKVLGINTGE